VLTTNFETLQISGVGTLMTGINFTTTILKIGHRA
jgi:heme/copper-type cytochrome/quinol oxidase subunit 1